VGPLTRQVEQRGSEFPCKISLWSHAVQSFFSTVPSASRYSPKATAIQVFHAPSDYAPAFVIGCWVFNVVFLSRVKRRNVSSWVGCLGGLILAASYVRT
jgi:hypothetical protein